MTNKQKQCLLVYLGYDTGGVDGIWGPMSIGATETAQSAYGLMVTGIFDSAMEARIRADIGAGTEIFATGKPPDKPEDGSSGTFWADIQYFKREEFRCTCGGRGCDGFPAEPVERLVRNAETARKHFGKPAIVSSGVRCQLRNSELPGSAVNSLHMRGKAMDYRIQGIPSATLLAYVKTLPGVDEAYAIDESYIHMGVEKY